MSVRASAWAWEASRSTGTAFLVLLALADHAGADGGDVYPSVGRLARRCRCDERTVQRSIATLIELGEIVLVEAGGGRRGTNRYRLTLRNHPQDGENAGENPPAECHPSEADPPAGGHHPPGNDDAKPRHHATRTVRTVNEPRRTAGDDAEGAAGLRRTTPRAAACPSCDGTGWVEVLDPDHEGATLVEPCSAPGHGPRARLAG